MGFDLRNEPQKAKERRPTQNDRNTHTTPHTTTQKYTSFDKQQRISRSLFCLLSTTPEDVVCYSHCMFYNYLKNMGSLGKLS